MVSQPRLNPGKAPEDGIPAEINLPTGGHRITLYHIPVELSRRKISNCLKHLGFATISKKVTGQCVKTTEESVCHT